MPFIQPFIHASIFYPPPTHLPFTYLSTHPPINFLLSFYSSFPYPPAPPPTHPSIYVPKYPHPSTPISSHTHLAICLPYIFLCIRLPSHPLFSPSSHLSATHSSKCSVSIHEGLYTQLYRAGDPADFGGSFHLMHMATEAREQPQRAALLRPVLQPLWASVSLLSLSLAAVTLL